VPLGRQPKQGGWAGQYFIDRDGYPVLTTNGQPVHLVVDENTVPVLDEHGQVPPTTPRVEGSGRTVLACPTPSRKRRNQPGARLTACHGVHRPRVQGNGWSRQPSGP